MITYDDLLRELNLAAHRRPERRGGPRGNERR